MAVPLLPCADDVLVWLAVWQDAIASMALDPQRELDLIGRLRDAAFDAAIIFTSFSQSVYPPAYVCYLAGIPIRAGQAHDFGGSLLTHRVIPKADSAHQVDRNLHIIESLGFQAAGRHLELRIPEAAQGSARQILRSRGVDPAGPYIVLAPGASCE